MRDCQRSDYSFLTDPYYQKERGVYTMNLLEVSNVSKTYGSGEAAVKALKKVSFSVPKGEYVAIVGESDRKSVV